MQEIIRGQIIEEERQRQEREFLANLDLGLKILETSLFSVDTQPEDVEWIRSSMINEAPGSGYEYIIFEGENYPVKQLKEEDRARLWELHPQGPQVIR